MNLRRKPNQKGFTMIELMVVVVIVAILAAIAIPIYGKYIRNARVTEATARIGEIVTAVKAFAQENQNPDDGTPTWPPAAGGGVIGDLPDPTLENFTIGVLEGGVGLDATQDANALTIRATGKNKMEGVTVLVTLATINANAAPPDVTGL